MGFAGFLRFDELINLRPCDIKVDGEMMSMNVQSKTDQLRQGDSVAVARTGTSTCPVAMLEQYLLRTSTAGDDKFLAHGEVLRNSGKISNSCLLESFKKKLKSLGFPSDSFALHSLRAGVATAAANAGVPDRLFKRHGRWQSENAKDGYVKDNLEATLKISKNIGLYPLT